MLKKFFPVIALALIANGCATKLDKGAEMVELKPISPADEGRKCKFLMEITETKWMGSREAVENQLRNTAKKLTGNYVHLVRSGSTGESQAAVGRVYDCPMSKRKK